MLNTKPKHGLNFCPKPLRNTHQTKQICKNGTKRSHNKYQSIHHITPLTCLTPNMSTLNWEFCTGPVPISIPLEILTFCMQQVEDTSTFLFNLQWSTDIKPKICAMVLDCNLMDANNLSQDVYSRTLMFKDSQMQVIVLYSYWNGFNFSVCNGVVVQHLVRNDTIVLAIDFSLANIYTAYFEALALYKCDVQFQRKLAPGALHLTSYKV